MTLFKIWYNIKYSGKQHSLSKLKKGKTMNPNKKTEQKNNGGRPNRDRVALVLDKKTLRSAALLVAFAIVLSWGLNHTEKPIALLGNIISAVSPL